MPTLSASIVVYTGAPEAMTAAQSVLKYTRRYDLTLYLIDNASPDGSGEVLERALERGVLSCRPNQHVEVIRSFENRGFGSGHNLVRDDLTSDYHFILNPDILIESDVLSDMADWMEGHPYAVMARPGLRFPSGEVQVLPLRRCSVRALVYRQLPFLKFWKKYNDRYVMADVDLTVPTRIEFCTGSFAMLRTRVFQKIGGFDEKYFMYVEDADLTQKACKEGEVYILPQFRAIHVWHRAAHNDWSHFKMQFRSMLRYFFKWGLRF